jgi:hypothetical protein
MLALVSENPKVIVLYMLIAAMIVLSHFGRKARHPETRE